MSKAREFQESSTATPAISIQNVAKVYPPPGWPLFTGGAAGKRALAGVSLDVQPGETVGLLGPNGAGKTTLLKIVATLLHPSSGSVTVCGIDALEHPRLARRNMGLVTCDERSFFWRLSGRKNLMFFADLYKVPRKVAIRRVGELLAVLGLEEAAERRFQTYSSGMKQKLAIARGLLANPTVLLFDEPTRSLDPASAANIREWIRKHRRPETAQILATNQLIEAELLCDKLLIINAGEIIAQGSVQAIRKMWHEHNHTLHKVVCRDFVPNGFLRPMPEKGLLEINSEAGEAGTVVLNLRLIEDSEALSHVLSHVLNEGGTVLRCESEQVPLEEVFCWLVKDKASAVSPVGGSR